MNATGSSSSSSMVKTDSSGPGSVKRVLIKNNLFLDIESLSKNV